MLKNNRIKLHGVSIGLLLSFAIVAATSELKIAPVYVTLSLFLLAIGCAVFAAEPTGGRRIVWRERKTFDTHPQREAPEDV